MKTIKEQLNGLLEYNEAKNFLKYSNWKGDKYEQDKQVLDWLIENNCEIRGYEYSKNTYMIRAQVKDLSFDFLSIGYHPLVIKNAERIREYLVYLLNRTNNIKIVMTKAFETYDEVCAKYPTKIDNSIFAHNDGSTSNIFKNEMTVIKKYEDIQKEQIKFENFCKTFVETVGKETPNFIF